MLLLKLVEETSSRVVYNYFPEKKEECGTVTFDKLKGEVIDVVISKNDSHNRYMHHAVSKICEFFDNNVYEKEYVVAWY